MLVITRRPGETIIVELPTGELIKVTVRPMQGFDEAGYRSAKHFSVVREDLLRRVVLLVINAKRYDPWHRSLLKTTHLPKPTS